MTSPGAASPARTHARKPNDRGPVTPNSGANQAGWAGPGDACPSGGVRTRRRARDT
ncbi:hypothetical protein YW7DRAFT_01355 [Streptomyces sp. AmelKG-E11A]|nr:hypothetical protein YW7DRAFT_01355 [Streptomyces sp. AmelKG-E11A]